MTDIGDRAEFSFVRYAQCWEDADILLQALLPQTGGHYLSIASGGENSFSLLSSGARVTAVDLSLPQLAVTDLKKAAYRQLSYDEFLGFLGVRPMHRRRELYRCELRPHLLPEHREWLDRQSVAVEGGILHCGKFEDYFRLFRRRVLPLVHNRQTICALLAGHPGRDARTAFYDEHWNNLRYRALFQLFFSRWVMGSRGRDAAFFRHVQGSVASRIKERVRTGLIEVNGPDNPYLQYILTGNFGDALPHALRRENFSAIKANLENLTLLRAPLEEAVGSFSNGSLAGYNLSDIFEYMSAAQTDNLYAVLLSKAMRGARLVYWNMLVPRQANRDRFGSEIRRLYGTGSRLLQSDKAFFYSRLLIEEKR